MDGPVLTDDRPSHDLQAAGRVRWGRTWRLVASVALPAVLLGTLAACIAHALVTPEHMEEVPILGRAFAASVVFGFAFLALLLAGPVGRTGIVILLAGVVGHALMFTTGGWSRIFGLTMIGEDVEPVTALWVIAMAGEAAVILFGSLLLAQRSQGLREAS